MGTTEFVAGNKGVRLPASTGNIANTEREFGNVMLRYNTTARRGEYSTDGTTWHAFGSGSGGGLFSLADVLTTDISQLADADEIRYIDKTDDGVHGLTLQKFKEFLVKHVPGTPEVPAVPGTPGTTVPGAVSNTGLINTTGNSHQLTQAQLDNYDMLWVLADVDQLGGAVPFPMLTSELKLGDTGPFQVGSDYTMSWTLSNRTLTVSGGGFDFMFLTNLTGGTGSITETILTPETAVGSGHDLILTQAQLDNNDWIWVHTLGSGGTVAVPLIFPTAVLKTKDFGNVRSGGGRGFRGTWTRDTTNGGGEFDFIAEIRRAIAIDGSVQSNSDVTPGAGSASQFPTSLSQAQVNANDFVWLYPNDAARHSYPTLMPMAILNHSSVSSLGPVRLSGSQRLTWTKSTRTLRNHSGANNDFWENIHLVVSRVADRTTQGTPGTPRVPAGPSGVSFRRSITDRMPHAIAANANATAAMLFKFVAVTATGTNRVLTFPDNLGEDGNYCKVGNAGSQAFLVSAYNAADTRVSKSMAAGAVIELEKNSGKWYFAE